MVAAIETEGLTRRFGAVEAVSGVDLFVPERSVFGFLGRNGAGKTTTIRLLLGLLRPSAGSARIFGIDVGRRLEAARRIGSLVEIPFHYDHLTGIENLAITARLLGLRKAEVGRVLDTVGLAADGGRRVGAYSLGMRQRLGVARALLGGPKLLILDEPTNGLDPDGIRDMRTLISTLPEREGVTLFVSSHVLAEVEQTATHIALMDKGRLVAQGAIGSLRDGARKRVSIKVRQPGRLLALLAETGIGASETVDGTVVIADSSAARAARDIAEINFMMVERGIEVLGIEVAEPSLEDFFVASLAAGRADAPANQLTRLAA
jgi:ABC-2 type transport system ATP-binding protein